MINFGLVISLFFGICLFDTDENHICASYGRRTLTFMPAISFVFPLLTTETFGPIAAE